MAKPPKKTSCPIPQCPASKALFLPQQSYVDWVYRFIMFYNKRYPKDIGASEIEALLSYLAAQRKVAASTQNPALSALVFLYRHVLRQAIGGQLEDIRAKQSRYLTVSQAQALMSKTQTQKQSEPKITAIIRLIETIMIYKFPQLSREEIERMFGLSELRQTKVYQEALQEGRQEGEQVGEARLILRLLTRRFGVISPDLSEQVQALSLSQLESLGEALLDFSHPSDLQEWFRSQV